MQNWEMEGIQLVRIPSPTTNMIRDPKENFLSIALMRWIPDRLRSLESERQIGSDRQARKDDRWLPEIRESLC